MRAREDPDRAVRGDPRAGSPRPRPVTWCDQLERARRPGPAEGPRPSASLGDSTLAVHAGSRTDLTTGAVGTPIYQNTTFVLNDETYRSVDEGYARDRFIYTRYGNPSQWAVQEKLAALEGAESSLVFSSGMAAIASTIFALADRGGHVLASSELYGGTYGLFQQELPRLGISVSFVDGRDLGAVRAAVRPETQVLYFEAVTNPLLKVVDVPGLAAIACDHGCRLVVDATFTSPVGLRPLAHGADVVVHSASKYLNGHSDVIAGAAAGSRKLMDRVWGRLLTFGGCLDPHACFLLERGLKTLPLRMRAHAAGALAVAESLARHPAVTKVHHPYFGEDEAVARRILALGGGMVSFEVAGGDAAALRLLDGLALPKQATSLGGVESLVSLPFNTSHAAFTAAQRASLGIGPGCVRYSVGLEDPADLVSDLAQGLSRL